jgi:hypothetical protein
MLTSTSQRWCCKSSITSIWIMISSTRLLQRVSMRWLLPVQCHTQAIHRCMSMREDADTCLCNRLNATITHPLHPSQQVQCCIRRQKYRIRIPKPPMTSPPSISNSAAETLRVIFPQNSNLRTVFGMVTPNLPTQPRS